MTGVIMFRQRAKPGEWSDERVNLLLALRAEQVEWREIKAAINKLPGAPIATVHSTICKYSKLIASANQNSRGDVPANTRPAAAGTSPAAGTRALDVSSLNSPPVPKEPEALFGYGGALLVTYEQARRWAVRNGLCHRNYGLDLNAVNAARVADGKAKFQIKGAL
jgi:hypothetical protein